MTDRELALSILTLAIDPRLNEMHESAWNAALEEISRDEITLIAASCAERALRDLAKAGLRIIDTRTHAAVPREPTREIVEAMTAAVSGGSGPDEDYFEDAEAMYRAAIAALVGTQTQGGEDGDV